jgi:hypothetical protein
MLVVRSGAFYRDEKYVEVRRLTCDKRRAPEAFRVTSTEVAATV